MIVKNSISSEVNGIIIFGEMGSGKDILADILVSDNKNVGKYNISKLVRNIDLATAATTKWSNNKRTLYQKYADKLRELDPEILNDYCLGLYYSKMQERLGLENREESPEKFRDTLLKQLCIMKKEEFPVIVGGRTLDDYKYWKNLNYFVVGIDCDSNIRMERLSKRDGAKAAKNSNQRHNTEEKVGHIVRNLADIIINNNGCIEELIDQCAYFNQILAG